MDRSTPLTLISKTYTTDAIGQRVPTETALDVYCNLRSVSRAEFFDAGAQGLRAEWVATMFAPDYSGQEIVELNGIRYGVYRTYLRQDEQIELYLERKAGV